MGPKIWHNFLILLIAAACSVAQSGEGDSSDIAPIMRPIIVSDCLQYEVQGTSLVIETRKYAGQPDKCWGRQFEVDWGSFSREYRIAFRRKIAKLTPSLRVTDLGGASCYYGEDMIEYVDLNNNGKKWEIRNSNDQIVWFEVERKIFNIWDIAARNIVNPHSNATAWPDPGEPADNLRINCARRENG